MVDELALPDAFGATDIGRRRTRNQDDFAVRHDLGFYAVADGVGSRPFGEVAAAMALETPADFLRGDAHWPKSAEGERCDLRAYFQATVEHANQCILDASAPDTRGMAATFVGALVRGQAVCILHLGDARAYRLRGGRLARLTEDHTHANELIWGGTPEHVARARSDAKALTRALGIEPRPMPGTRLESLIPGDVLLLCSDGLHRVVTEAEIAEILAAQRDAQTTVQTLIARANELGGPDNIAAVVVRWSSVAERMPRPSMLAGEEPVLRTVHASASRREIDRFPCQDVILERPELGLFAVADSRGGGLADITAAHAILAVTGTAVEQAKSAPRVPTLAVVVERSSTVLHHEARGNINGASFTCLLLVGREATVVHVGDCRCYRLHGGTLEQLTTDHTFLVDAVRGGVLTRDEAERSPFRDVLTRGIGLEPGVELEVRRFPVGPGDRFLLATDGLHRAVCRDRMEAILLREPSVERAAAQLVQAALDAGGSDDVTALLVRVEPKESAS